MSDETLGDPLRTMHRKPFMLLCCFLRGVIDVQPLHSQIDAWHHDLRGDVVPVVGWFGFQRWSLCSSHLLQSYFLTGGVWVRCVVT